MREAVDARAAMPSSSGGAVSWRDLHNGADAQAGSDRDQWRDAAGGGLSIIAGEASLSRPTPRGSLSRYLGIGARAELRGLDFSLPPCWSQRWRSNDDAADVRCRRKRRKDASEIYPFEEFYRRARIRQRISQRCRLKRWRMPNNSQASARNSSLETADGQERQAISACGRTADFAEGSRSSTSASRGYRPLNLPGGLDQS